MARDPKSIQAEEKALQNLEAVEARLLVLANRRSAAARREKQELKEKKEAIEKYVEKLKLSDEAAKDATDSFKQMTESMSLSSRATSNMGKSLASANKYFRGIQSASKSMLIDGNEQSVEAYNNTQKIAAAAAAVMDAQQNMLNAGIDQTAAEAAELEKAANAASTTFMSLVETNQQLLKDYPQINEYVLNLKNNIRDVAKELRITHGLTADEIDQYKELTAEGEKLKARFKSVGDMIITAIKKPAVLLGAAIMAIGQAVSKLGESFREFGGDLGGAVYSAAALSIFFKEGTNVAKGLASEFGSMKDISFGTQLNTNLMAVNLGISGDEAAKLVGGFARLNEGSIDIANNMVATTKAMSEAAGVNTAAVAADIAQNMGKFAEYSSDGGENLISAGIAAAKLGVNLGTVASVADSLLDFEQSITKELELGALLGRNINLNEARTLAYRGKTGAALKSVIKELGGIQAYNDMDVYAKRETAALLGIGVDELQRMVSNYDKLNDAGEVQKSQWSTMNEGLTALLTGPFGTLISSMGALIMLGLQSWIQWGMIKSAVDRVTGSILQMNAAQNSGSVTQTLTNAPGPMTRGGKPDMRFKANRLPATPQPSVASNVNQTGGGINMRSVLQGAAAMLILAGALFVFAKAAQEFGGVKWDDVFIGIGAMATLGVVAGVLGIGPIATAVGIGTLLILGLASAFFIFGAASVLMATAVTMIANSLPLLASGITSLIPMIGGIIGLGVAFAALGAGLAVFASMGSVAIPLLLAVGAASAGLGILMSSSSEETTAVEGGSLEQTVKDGLQNVVNAINNKNFDVYLDKSKVTNLIFAEERSKTRNNTSITPRGI